MYTSVEWIKRTLIDLPQYIRKSKPCNNLSGHKAIDMRSMKAYLLPYGQQAQSKHIRRQKMNMYWTTTQLRNALIL